MHLVGHIVLCQLQFSITLRLSSSTQIDQCLFLFVIFCSVKLWNKWVGAWKLPFTYPLCLPVFNRGSPRHTSAHYKYIGEVSRQHVLRHLITFSAQPMLSETKCTDRVVNARLLVWVTQGRGGYAEGQCNFFLTKKGKGVIGMGWKENDAYCRSSGSSFALFFLNHLSQYFPLPVDGAAVLCVCVSFCIFLSSDSPMSHPYNHNVS